MPPLLATVLVLLILSAMIQNCSQSCIIFEFVVDGESIIGMLSPSVANGAPGQYVIEIEGENAELKRYSACTVQ